MVSAWWTAITSALSSFQAEPPDLCVEAVEQPREQRVGVVLELGGVACLALLGEPPCLALEAAGVQAVDAEALLADCADEWLCASDALLDAEAGDGVNVLEREVLHGEQAHGEWYGDAVGYAVVVPPACRPHACRGGQRCRRCAVQALFRVEN